MAENAGVKATELISTLYAAHSNGEKNIGFDIEVSHNNLHETFRTLIFTFH